MLCNNSILDFLGKKMLPSEGEDLLEQLSGDLGIPEFLQDLPMLEENGINETGNIYESLINDIPTTTASLFPDLSMETKDCMAIDFNTTTFPPSPSNSDTSSGYDCKDAVPLSYAEVSPPVSPPSMMNMATAHATSIVSVSVTGSAGEQPVSS